MIIVFAVAFLASCVTASIVTPVQNSSADTVTTNISNTGYYVTVTSHDVELDLTSTPAGSTAIDSDTVTVTTNCPSGFKLYISSNSSTSGSSYMYNSADDDYYLLNTTGSLSNSNSLKALDTNSWGYTLLSNDYGNTGSITSSSNFVGLPLLGSENLIRSTNSANTTGISTDVYFGVKANTALPAGSYVGTVAYTVFAEATDGTTEDISVSPAVVTTGDTITIATPLYTDQEDLGTITASVGGRACVNPTRATGSGTNLINITCTIPDISSNGDKNVVINFSKYGASYSKTDAIYYYIPWASLAYMQDMTSYACDDATIATSTDPADYDRSTNYSYQRILTDNRDSNTYIVRKLKDGNCWMTENLRLTFQNGQAVDVNDSTKLTTLTSDNSDFTTLSSWAGGGTTETSSSHTVWYADNGNMDNLIKSYTFSNEKSDDDPNQYKGTLYNWNSATAGKGLYDTLNGTKIEDSICPKGWQLPSINDWQQVLYSPVENDALISIVLGVPYSIIRTGTTYYGPSGSLTNEIRNTIIWSATKNFTGTYDIGFLSSGSTISIGDYVNIGWGGSVRCVSR